jgi:4-aminobutyrate aminotransferase
MRKETDRTEGDVNASPLRNHWIEECVSPETRGLLEEDSRYFLHQSLSTPCLNALESCEGSLIRDMDGREYLDFHGNSVHQVGYGNPRVIEAVKKQLDLLPFCPRRYTNGVAVALARRLALLAPGDLNKVLLAPAGALAVSMALKLARVATGRFKTISFWGAFHGATLDAISVGGEAMFRDGIGPLLPGAIHVAPPEDCRGDDNALSNVGQIESVMEREGDIAAVIAEPIRCTDVTRPGRAYWRRVRELCDRHGALLIFDEVPTCLGRTGVLFACEHYGVVPDILCIGKGLGGGVMPMAAVIARDGLDAAAPFSLGHFTHEKSPVGCAAALATLDCIEEEGLVERSRLMGAQLLESLRVLQKRHACIRELRGIGLLVGVELGEDPATGRAAGDLAEQMLYACLRRGLSFKVSGGKTLTLAPPLTVTGEELDRAVGIIDASLNEILAQ